MDKNQLMNQTKDGNNIITVQYAYDKQSIKVGDVRIIEHEGQIYNVECLSHQYMSSSQWVPGGTIIYKILNNA